LIFLIILYAGCDRILIQEDLSSRDPQANLDYLWEQADKKYSYFDLKGIDWNEVYTEYNQKIFPEMSGDSLFNVLGGMLTELKDDHTNLISGFNVSFFGVENLGQDNFDWDLIEDYYLPRNYYISGPFSHDYLKGTRDQVGYVRFSSFTGSISEGNLGFVLQRYQFTKGLILDLRENGGGSISDVYSLLSRFVNEETLVLYSRVKSGPGHNDFSEAEPAYVTPNDGTQYQRKVIVLVDRGTYSAGSFTALATKAIPNLVLMGDTTGGGLGLPNGGQLPNGWRYRFSITQTLDTEFNNEFENGVPPDILQMVDWTVMDRDEIIDRAVQEILQ
jgi:hypothetical protein